MSLVKEPKEIAKNQEKTIKNDVFSEDFYQFITPNNLKKGWIITPKRQRTA